MHILSQTLLFRVQIISGVGDPVTRHPTVTFVFCSLGPYRTTSAGTSSLKSFPSESLESVTSSVVLLME